MANVWRNVRCGDGTPGTRGGGKVPDPQKDRREMGLMVGCYEGCKYRDFRPFDASMFRQVVQTLWVDDDDNSQWRHKSRGVILGKMHEAKLSLWNDSVERCPQWGMRFAGDTADDDDIIPF